MAFIGEYCIYNGISSEQFGLHIVNENGSMEVNSGGEITIQKSCMMGGLKYAYMGREAIDPCEIHMTLMREKPMDAAEISAVMRWLGSVTYKELRIVQPDISTVKFNCIFTEISTVQHGNETYGVSVVGECDSCFGEGNPITVKAVGKSASINLMNNGDYMDDVYLVVTIKMPTGGGGLTITNTSMYSRMFIFNDLSGSEQLTMDCLRKTIETSSSVRRLDNFNKNWLPLLPGMNNLSYLSSTGEGEIEIQCPCYRRIGN